MRDQMRFAPLHAPFGDKGNAHQNRLNTRQIKWPLQRINMRARREPLKDEFGRGHP
jgi:hypothetical protein